MKRLSYTQAMRQRGFQRGFVGSGLMDLAFLLVLVLIGWGLWAWLSTIVQGDFATAVAFIGLMATGTAWWWTKDQCLVLRVPVGFILYLVLVAVLGALTVWSSSKIAVAAAAGVAALAARYLGAAISGPLQRKIQHSSAEGQAPPWWLDQSINLIDDLARWVGASVVAWFLIVVPPMLLVFVMPPAAIPWVALVWAFAAMAFYTGRRPVRGLVSGYRAWVFVFVITAVLLKVFQKQIAGPLEPGSFEQISYMAYWPVVVALFVEFVALGTPRPART